MAIRVRNPIRINPLDTIDKVGVGIKLPFNRKNIFTLDFTTKDHAKSKLINLLLTDQGERVFQPLFGVGLRRLLFEQEIDSETLRERINNQAQIYIPEISVDNIQVKPEGNQVYLTVNYTLLFNNEGDGIALSFTNTNTNTL